MAKVRKRETTAHIAVIFTKTGRQVLSDWDVVLADRKRGVLGHGAHHLILRDGENYPTRDHAVYGNVELECDSYNDDSVFIRVVGDRDTMTDAQCDALEDVIADLQEAYPDAEVVYPN
ncbi:N-acetylmuramoyl-L-alanine amidase [Vibrio fluvialis]|uniref:N-acetylmuramoyl-L-alanine amidase n=1 Tax=Vibrio vulnificus TaxID=672 RepID=UPI0001F5BDE3|nr:N-acetylmuramoyl-L-alanine amidase [Vibrio vulnificus]ADV88574.1 hypothetical protein VVMO6_03552 [Vibrio vulnificus MO6-24/O]